MVTFYLVLDHKFLICLHYLLLQLSTKGLDLVKQVNGMQTLKLELCTKNVCLLGTMYAIKTRIRDLNKYLLHTFSGWMLSHKTAKDLLRMGSVRRLFVK